MSFSAYELRYHLEKSYPTLIIHLQYRAKRHLGHLKFDAIEVDQVVGHVIEYLSRINLLGGGDYAPQTALDGLSDVQFRSFLNRMVENKAIDCLRRRRISMSTTGELETDEENDPLNAVVEPFWGTIPFASPEEAVLEIVSQLQLRANLKKCIETLGAAPLQLQAILQELESLGAFELVQEVRAELNLASESVPVAHLSQQKDHAHKKLRLCLQKQSTNLAVMVALRLIEYGPQSKKTASIVVSLQTLTQDGLSLREVSMGLRHLAQIGLLDWHGEEEVQVTPDQHKQLTRFYEDE